MDPQSSESLENRIIADPELQKVAHRFRARCDALAERLASGDFARISPQLVVLAMAEGFVNLGADEGTLWFADKDQEFLQPVFNSGPRASEIVGSFRQPLDSGIVSMVYASEQSFCENEVYANRQQHKELDQNLAVITCSMMVSPVSFSGRIRGVISCVKLKPADQPEMNDPPGFTASDLQRFNCLADVTGSLIDGHLMSICFGIE